MASIRVHTSVKQALARMTDIPPRMESARNVIELEKFAAVVQSLDSGYESCFDSVFIVRWLVHSHIVMSEDEDRDKYLEDYFHYEGYEAVNVDITHVATNSVLLRVGGREAVKADDEVWQVPLAWVSGLLESSRPYPVNVLETSYSACRHGEFGLHMNQEALHSMLQRIFDKIWKGIADAVIMVRYMQMAAAGSVGQAYPAECSISVGHTSTPPKKFGRPVACPVRRMELTGSGAPWHTQLAMVCHVSCSTDHCDVKHYGGENVDVRHIPGCDELCGSYRVKAASAGQVFNVVTGAFLSRREQVYACISHVWRHGLFGNAEGFMTACVRARLAGLAGALGVDCVWIDSVCIPNNEAMRRDEIKAMGSIYSGARCMVVMDADMMATRFANQFEVLEEIGTSDWSKRVWTLQEGVLSRLTYVDTLDGLMRLDPWWCDRPPLMSTVGDILRAASSKVYCTGDKTWSLDMVMHDLQGRSTAKPEDVWLAVAGLLGASHGDGVVSAGTIKHSNWYCNTGILMQDADMDCEPGFCFLPKNIANVYGIDSRGHDVRRRTSGLPAIVSEPLHVAVAPVALPVEVRALINDPIAWVNGAGTVCAYSQRQALRNGVEYRAVATFSFGVMGKLIQVQNLGMSADGMQLLHKVGVTGELAWDDCELAGVLAIVGADSAASTERLPATRYQGALGSGNTRAADGDRQLDLCYSDGRPVLMREVETFIGVDCGCRLFMANGWCIGCGTLNAAVVGRKTLREGPVSVLRLGYGNCKLKIKPSKLSALGAVCGLAHPNNSSGLRGWLERIGLIALSVTCVISNENVLLCTERVAEIDVAVGVNHLLASNVIKHAFRIGVVTGRLTWLQVIKKTSSQVTLDDFLGGAGNDAEQSMQVRQALVALQVIYKQSGRQSDQADRSGQDADGQYKSLGDGRQPTRRRLQGGAVPRVSMATALATAAVGIGPGSVAGQSATMNEGGGGVVWSLDVVTALSAVPIPFSDMYDAMMVVDGNPVIRPLTFGWVAKSLRRLAGSSEPLTGYDFTVWQSQNMGASIIATNPWLSAAVSTIDRRSSAGCTMFHIKQERRTITSVVAVVITLVQLVYLVVSASLGGAWTWSIVVNILAGVLAGVTDWIAGPTLMPARYSKEGRRWSLLAALPISPGRLFICVERLGGKAKNIEDMVHPGLTQGQWRLQLFGHVIALLMWVVSVSNMPDGIGPRGVMLGMGVATACVQVLFMRKQSLNQITTTHVDTTKTIDAVMAAAAAGLVTDDWLPGDVLRLTEVEKGCIVALRSAVGLNKIMFHSIVAVLPRVDAAASWDAYMEILAQRVAVSGGRQ